MPHPFIHSFIYSLTVIGTVTLARSPLTMAEGPPVNHPPPHPYPEPYLFAPFMIPFIYLTFPNTEGKQNKTKQNKKPRHASPRPLPQFIPATTLSDINLLPPATTRIRHQPPAPCRKPYPHYRKGDQSCSQGKDSRLRNVPQEAQHDQVDTSTTHPC